MANLAAAAAGRLSQAAILSAPATAPVPSRTLAEAQQRARYFYRQVRTAGLRHALLGLPCAFDAALPRRACAQLCRQIPWIMKNYHLDEVTTRSALRSKLASHFRRVETDNPQVVDVLLFKGQAEAHELMAHYTQRHHLVRCPSVRPSTHTRVVVSLPRGCLTPLSCFLLRRLLGM